MRFQQALVLPMLLATVLAGCKKDPANERPRITIVSPPESYSLGIPDTVLVTVEASDDRGLENVAVTLLDQNDIPVVAGVSTSASGTSAVRTLALPVTSEQISSGPYKLLATASDGSLTGKDVTGVHVTAAPWRVRAVFTLAVPGPGSLALHKTDSTGQTTQAMLWSMDLGGAAISSPAQRIFIAGGSSGDLQALSPDGLGVRWSRPNQSSVGIPWFTSVDLCADGRLYVGRDDGTIHGYLASNGIGGTVITMPAMFRATQCITLNDLLICTMRHFVTGEQRVGIYYRQSGAPFATQPLALEPVGLFARDADHVLVFGNNNGQGRVVDRTLSGGGTWEAYTWSSPITAVERLSDLTWLVALANGDLQRFTYGGAGSLSIGTTPVLGTLAYDPVNGLVYGGTEGSVLLINPATGASTEGWTVAGPVLRVLPLLNR